jgi:hypothetical protein
VDAVHGAAGAGRPGRQGSSASEAVATGASILLIFGFFGALATVTLYLVDRGGRATLGVSRALLALVTLEGGGAIILAHEVSSHSICGVAAVLLVIAALAFGLTFMPWLVEFKDTLRSRPSETFGPAPGPSPGPDGEQRPLFASDWRLLVLVAPLILALVFAAVHFLAAVPAWGTVAGIVAILGLTAITVNEARRRKILKKIRKDMKAEQGYRLEREKKLREDAERTGEDRRKKSREGEDKKLREREEEKERLRFGKHRPHRFTFTLEGGLALVLLAIVAVAFPALVLKEWWFAVSIGTAVILGFGLWRIACLAKPGFVWFGLAVFLSVPLFGALSLMARNVGHPEAQPMALIRKTDGPDESIQGLYVTETSDRVYFANVATEGCGSEVKRHSGRLLWVPSDEVVAMSIGPLESVKEASTSALEMAYELTPSVETPAAGAVSLTVPEKRSKSIENAERKRQAKEVEEHAPGLDQRLQNPGPAVRPNFGSGLQLVPEIASPGEEVELRLSMPNRKVDGFGSRPGKRMLRLNGVPVEVEREATSQASDAEYVETVGGQVLALDGKGAYGRRDHKPEPLSQGEHYERPRYVKLSDSLVEEVVGKHNGLAPRYSSFLAIHEHGNGAMLDKRYKPEVKLAGNPEPVRLESGFQRQAWHEGAIAFKVPRHAKSGVVTVDCGQLAGSPLLRVAAPPVARIEARMRGGSKRVVLNGRRSREANGKQLNERWKLGKRSLGKHKRVALTLRPRMRPYRVRLTVTDPEGVSGSTELLLLRLPESFFEFGKATLPKKRQVERLERAHASLEGFVRRHPPSSIELDGNADDVGSAPFNVTLFAGTRQAGAQDAAGVTHARLGRRARRHHPSGPARVRRDVPCHSPPGTAAGQPQGRCLRS